MGQKEQASFSHFPEDEDKGSIQNAVLKRAVVSLDNGQEIGTLVVVVVVVVVMGVVVVVKSW